MKTISPVRRAVRCALVASAASAMLPVYAQNASIDEVVVTGTRITVPGAVSSSPIASVSAEEIQLQQQPEVEKILRIMPITFPGDGQNTNNGTAGASTVNLRGLGAQRNLILVNGKRLTPYNFNGLVDTSTIPTALVERIDIVTGGASAVYGSDAISGALNFILRRDFEGVELDSDFSQYDEKDGATRTASLTFGSNVADGRGNVVFSLNWTDREGVQLGSRPLGNVGIDSSTGAGYADFLAGRAMAGPPDNCGGPNAVLDQNTTATTLPSRVFVAGGPELGQFREDGTLASACNGFNFNPYNYYQTPQERYGGMVLGHLELNEHAEAYARFGYSSTNVKQQVAPSGIFGTPFWTPLANPLMGDAARNEMIRIANEGRTAVGANGQPAPTVNTGGTFPNWRDINGNGVVDAADELNISYFRRTVEFGERSTAFDNEAFQVLVGVRGDIVSDWSYDVSLQFGESNRTNLSQGYTNVSNIANAVNSVDGVTCRTGGATCVPINLFGAFGTITPEMVAYSSASALEQQTYEQRILSASVNGPIEPIRLPWASTSLAVSVGAEYREESAQTVPDECWKLQPSSCLGGAGGALRPIAGGFDVREVFAEALLPVADDLPGIHSLDLELGYRHSDYNLTGTDSTHKYGLTWKPIEQLMFRAMKQRAARAPNVGELAAPQRTALSNATRDPCSRANLAISAELRARCIGTGMSDAQVGTVQNIAAGQINVFAGTDLETLPAPEQADTTTFGVVWTPSLGGMIRNATVSLDYYDIDIQDFIGTFAPQEVLDGCYGSGQEDQCAKIRRIGGTLTLPGSGIEVFTTNLDYLRAEGVELGFSFGLDIGRFGSLAFSGTMNKYLTQESQSSVDTPVLDCMGFYGKSCGAPLPETRWIERTTWNYGDLSVSLLWRHLGAAEVERVQYAGTNRTFEQFRQIDSYDYFDLYAGYTFRDRATLSLGIVNLFSKDPPIVGNNIATTGSNSGNTFPSVYDPLGRMFSLGLNVGF